MPSTSRRTARSQRLAKRRANAFYIQRLVARKIGNAETAAEVDERRGNTPLLRQFCGKRHRLRLRLDQCRRIEILRAGKDMKATKITARIPEIGREHV